MIIQLAFDIIWFCNLVQSLTYTSLNVLIVIIQVSVWLTFLFFLEMHKIYVFLKLQVSSDIYCCQTGGSQQFGTFVMWKHVLTSLGDGQRKYSAIVHWLQLEVQTHCSPLRRRSIFLSISCNCQASLPKILTVQIFSPLLLMVLPSAARTSELQLESCHRDGHLCVTCS